jgi:hypothetical protein
MDPFCQNLAILNYSQLLELSIRGLSDSFSGAPGGGVMVKNGEKW